jgi:hypothetical protein
VDDIFLEMTGIRFRSNATFGSGNTQIANDYGATCALFAVGNFKFCWSPRVKDLTFDLLDAEYLKELKVRRISAKPYIQNQITISNYQTSDLIAGIDSGNEVMVHATAGYYLLKTRNRNKLNSILDALDTMMRK